MLSLTCSHVLLSYSKTASYAGVPLYNKSPIGPERQVSTELWFRITVFYVVQLSSLHLVRVAYAAQFMRVTLNVAFLV